MIEEKLNELKSGFIFWSNFLDDELWIMYYISDRLSNNVLDNKKFFYYDMLEDLYRMNEQYLCLEGARFAHPNYEKAAWRLNRLLDLISSEIDARKN